MAEPTKQGEPIETCGCESPPKRVCDLCQAPPRFVACSLACLRRHQNEAHGITGSSASPSTTTGAQSGARVADEAPLNEEARTRAPLTHTEIRASQYQSRINRNIQGHWVRYGAHRRELMSLLGSLGTARDICILGAGNCTDLDPVQLARDYGEMHLVDLDAEALSRGRASFPPEAQDRVVLHAGIDLSGFAGRIDEWGETFPDKIEITQAARAAIVTILGQLGRTYEVVLSDCVLSQLPTPYKRTLIMSRTNWSTLFSSITAVHLATLTGSVAPGGSGILACDVAGADASPVLRNFRGSDGAELEAFVREQVARGQLQLDPEPQVLLERLTSPAMKTLVEEPRLAGPWLWDTGDLLVVYGLVFRRPAPAIGQGDR